jgi:hypothetical protein
MIRIRENLFEEMLQEPDEVAMKRKRTRETLRVLQQAFRVSFPDLVTSSRGLSEFMGSSNSILFSQLHLVFYCKFGG